MPFDAFKWMFSDHSAEKSADNDPMENPFVWMNGFACTLLLFS